MMLSEQRYGGTAVQRRFGAARKQRSGFRSKSQGRKKAKPRDQSGQACSQQVDIFFITPQRTVNGRPWADPPAGQRSRHKKAAEPSTPCRLTDQNSLQTSDVDSL